MANPGHGRIVLMSSLRCCAITLLALPVALHYDGADPAVPHGAHVGAVVCVWIGVVAVALVFAVPASRRFMAGDGPEIRMRGGGHLKAGTIPVACLLILAVEVLEIAGRVSGSGDAGDVGFLGLSLVLFVGLADLVWCRLLAGRYRVRRSISVSVAYAAVILISVSVLVPLAHQRITDHRACLMHATVQTCLARG